MIAFFHFPELTIFCVANVGQRHESKLDKRFAYKNKSEFSQYQNQLSHY